jgi:hypothetical protein
MMWVVAFCATLYICILVGSIIATHFEVSNHDDTLIGVLSSLLLRLIVGAVAVLFFIWIAH